MLKEDRLDAIVSLCNERRSLTVREAAKALGTSDMTARRDFDELAAEGRIIRVYGGARSVREDGPDHEAAAALSASNAPIDAASINKGRIARLAASLIEEGDIIYLGSGTTVEGMVPHLPHCRLRIVTSDLAVFGLVVDAEAYDLGLYEVYLTGGEYHKATMTFDGSLTYDALRSFGMTKTFVGTNGISNDAIYGNSQSRGYALRLALDASDRKYVMADSSKIGQRDLTAFYALHDIDALITDPDITREQRELVEPLTQVIC